MGYVTVVRRGVALLVVVVLFLREAERWDDMGRGGAGGAGAGEV